MNAQDRGAEPAYPITPPLDLCGNSAVGYPYPANGLTKREAFAMAAMQALIAAQPERMYDEISDDAVLHAESLLNRLSLNQEPRT